MNKNRKCLMLAYDIGYRCDQHGNVFSSKGNKLKLYSDKLGYLYFSVKLPLTLHYKSISRAIPVHRLQAYQKFGEKLFETGLHVRHLNSVCGDNSYENISIGSVSDNMMDKSMEMRLTCSINASNHIRKFTDDDMIKIKEFHDEHKSYKKTMEEFKISSKGTLHHMLNKNYVTKK